MGKPNCADQQMVPLAEVLAIVGEEVGRCEYDWAGAVDHGYTGQIERARLDRAKHILRRLRELEVNDDE